MKNFGLTAYGHSGGLVGALTVGQSEDVEARLGDLVRAHESLIALSGDPAGVR